MVEFYLQNAQAWVWLAGVLGAVIPAVVRRGMSVKEILSTVFVGIVVSFYGTAPMAHFIYSKGTADLDVIALISLLLGTLGMSLCQILLSIFDKYGSKMAEKAVMKYFNMYPPDPPVPIPPSPPVSQSPPVVEDKRKG